MTDLSTAGRTLTERVVAGTGWVIAWRAATRNLGLISTLVLVRLLTPADFGLVALGSAFVSTVDALSWIGVQDALMRLPNPSREEINSAFGMGILRGAATALLIAASAVPTAAFFGEPRLVVILLTLAAGTLLSSFENIGTVEFRRQMSFQKEFQLQIVGRVMGVVVTVVLAWVWHNYWALIAGLLTARVVRLAQSYIMSEYRPAFTLCAWRRLVGFSLWSWAGTIVWQIRERADSIVIGRISGTDAVAVFSVGLEIGFLPITELIEPMHRTLFSAFLTLNHSGQNVRQLYLNAVEAGFMVILPAGVGISLVADPVVRLMLGERWLDAIPVVQVLGIVGTLSVFRLTSDALNSAAGHLRANFVLNSISVALRVPLLVLLVGYFGLTGASMAIGAAILLDQLLFLHLTFRRLEISVKQLAGRLWRAIVASMMMTGALWLLGLAWIGVSATGTWALLGDLLGRIAIGVAVYALAVLAIWLAAGRPDGAERYLLGVVFGAWRRLFAK